MVAIKKADQVKTDRLVIVTNSGHVETLKSKP